MKPSEFIPVIEDTQGDKEWYEKSYSARMADNYMQQWLMAYHTGTLDDMIGFPWEDNNDHSKGPKNQFLDYSPLVYLDPNVQVLSGGSLHILNKDITQFPPPQTNTYDWINLYHHDFKPTGAVREFSIVCAPDTNTYSDWSEVEDGHAEIQLNGAWVPLYTKPEIHIGGEPPESSIRGSVYINDSGGMYFCNSTTPRDGGSIWTAYGDARPIAAPYNHNDYTQIDPTERRLHREEEKIYRPSIDPADAGKVKWIETKLKSQFSQGIELDEVFYAGGWDDEIADIIEPVVRDNKLKAGQLFFAKGDIVTVGLVETKASAIVKIKAAPEKEISGKLRGYSELGTHTFDETVSVTTDENGFAEVSISELFIISTIALPIDPWEKLPAKIMFDVGTTSVESIELVSMSSPVFEFASEGEAVYEGIIANPNKLPTTEKSTENLESMHSLKGYFTNDGDLVTIDTSTGKFRKKIPTPWLFSSNPDSTFCTVYAHSASLPWADEDNDIFFGITVGDSISAGPNELHMNPLALYDYRFLRDKDVYEKMHRSYVTADSSSRSADGWEIYEGWTEQEGQVDELPNDENTLRDSEDTGGEGNSIHLLTSSDSDGSEFSFLHWIFYASAYTISPKATLPDDSTLVRELWAKIEVECNAWDTDTSTDVEHDPWGDGGKDSIKAGINELDIDTCWQLVAILDDNDHTYDYRGSLAAVTSAILDAGGIEIPDVPPPEDIGDGHFSTVEVTRSVTLTIRHEVRHSPRNFSLFDEK